MSKINVQKALKELDTLRTTLYLNEDRVKQWFDQLGGDDEEGTSNEIGSQISAGLPNWLANFAGAISGKKGRSNRKQISKSPVLMAVGVEHYLRVRKLLLELPTESYRKTKWIKYTGKSCVTTPKENIIQLNAQLEPSQAEVVHDHRVRQEERLKLKNPKATTLVWTAPGNPCFASIANMEWVNIDNLASDYYHPAGIFGDFESKDDEVIFIRPCWIWYEVLDNSF